MTTYNFGVGNLYGRRTDVTPSTPVAFGTLQEVSLDFDQSLVELKGQYKYPVDVAAAIQMIKGKAKFARIQANIFNDMFFGQTMTTATGAVQQISGESHTIATTVTSTQAATFKEDLGVTYQATGVAFVKVASAPAVGQYSVNESTGVYTFNATDVGLLALLNYTYGAGVLTTITIANQLMGSSPSFEVHLGESYKNNAGTLSTPYFKLNACKSSKLSLPFKNVNYTEIEMDFQAFADSANNIGQMVFTE